MKNLVGPLGQANPPVDLHWFFEISIRTEEKIQLELKKKSVISTV